MSNKDIVKSHKWADAAVRPFESLGRALEDLFDLPLTGPKAVNTPEIDIRETDKTIEVSVALPGIEKKDINLDLREEKGSGGYRMKEQSYGRFYRAFTLPAAVKPDEAKAVYKDGVLNITMGKQKTDKARQITVE
jgi:HSP20 family protein